ncbi:MAG: class II aldolase/adducin family protein [Spartobacteria bacterium]|nr:class II aldolase/adducin family protein [Spartobacteria bacterium]
MAIIRQELAGYGQRIAARGLTAGAGGNISARDGRFLWIKPSGLAMEELRGRDMTCVDLACGAVIEGRFKPSSELPLHLGIYRARPDVNAIFHTHSPWASGVITSDADIRPMFAEVVNDLGGITTVPYIITGSRNLADAVTEAALQHETIFMMNHGVVALGRSMKQAYFRCCVAEDAAKSFVAASLAGNPRFLSHGQIQELMALETAAYRTRMAEMEGP